MDALYMRIHIYRYIYTITSIPSIKIKYYTFNYCLQNICILFTDQMLKCSHHSLGGGRSIHPPPPQKVARLTRKSVYRGVLVLYRTKCVCEKCGEYEESYIFSIRFRFFISMLLIVFNRNAKYYNTFINNCII